MKHYILKNVMKILHCTVLCDVNKIKSVDYFVKSFSKSIQTQFQVETKDLSAKNNSNWSTDNSYTKEFVRLEQLVFENRSHSFEREKEEERDYYCVDRFEEETGLRQVNDDKNVSLMYQNM